jgi:hypothetical protein
MKRIIRLLILPVLAMSTLVFAAPSVAYACATDGSEIPTSFFGCVKKSGTGESNPIFVGLLTVFNFLAVGVGVVVVGGIIYGGILISAGGGDAARTKQGTTLITNSVIGLVAFMFMYAFINFIVPGGLFK